MGGLWDLWLLRAKGDCTQRWLSGCLIRVQRVMEREGGPGESGEVMCHRWKRCGMVSWGVPRPGESTGPGQEVLD